MVKNSSSLVNPETYENCHKTHPHQSPIYPHANYDVCVYDSPPTLQTHQ